MKYKVATSFDIKKYFSEYQTSNHQTRVLCEAENMISETPKKGERGNIASPPQTPVAPTPLTLNRAQSELGEDFDEEDAVPVEVVEGEFADGGAGDNDAET